MRDDEREVQLFFAGSGQDFRRVGYGGSEHFGRLRIQQAINSMSYKPLICYQANGRYIANLG